MKRYGVRLSSGAERDLCDVLDYVAAQTSQATADAYLTRIERFLSGLAWTPHRGSLRNDIRNGLRVIGFERRITVAFVVEEHEVIVLRVLYAGRTLTGV